MCNIKCWNVNFHKQSSNNNARNVSRNCIPIDTAMEFKNMLLSQDITQKYKCS